ncbi:lipoprotein-anchoring transpeptidase ErfK/SrfK [Mycolicibacterium iranicum]|uniref:Lipoprotein-anchoring transpeptidase ErfK/SrfK n=1 Tax=Mycolicibacterium iranicum TaxID=912594 RepID=A0A839Q1P5_MYCIR|nr:Ig-like domain-containing protein [Mycolicibacterium iranicum]MBB2988844.1 lipoprotein-anchoring transpeptidase ErfK/SrfK [Mycolicibacterium iranicum]
MRQRNRTLLTAFFMVVGVVAGMTLGAPSALAQPAPAPAPPPAPNPPANPFVFPNPFAPPAPPAAATPATGPTESDPFAVVPGQPMTIPEGTPAGQNPTPFVGQPPFVPPSFNPTNGSIAGAAKPIYINFQRPIANRQMAEDAIHISSNPPVPGRFYWTSDTQVRWRPQDFWPAGTTVNIDAAGTKSSFTVPEQLVATVDNDTKQMEIVRNGVVEKTFPVSMGKSGYDTKNGTYYVLEKFADIVMDSSTYGVPVDDPSGEGYKLKVQDAVRIDNSGVFVHSAPWSVGDQGESNVSHGCINLSPANAQWFYDNFGSGDAVVIKNTDGGLYTQPDGASDWQMF